MAEGPRKDQVRFAHCLKTALNKHIDDMLGASEGGQLMRKYIAKKALCG